MTDDRAAAYSAYARYQSYAQHALDRYTTTRQSIWSDICTACIRLSLVEAR